MARYETELAWRRGDADFLGGRYSRRHLLRFDGGLEVPASSSPAVVPEPMSDPSAMDPEEAFVAALASCHMLWFLAVAAERRFCVDSYRDRAVGTLGKNASGRLAITEVVLRPEAVFSGGRRPTLEEIADLHAAAHERCFIASSVRTDVRCEPVLESAQGESMPSSVSP